MPGDKSISHRYAILAAMAEGISEFENFATGEDCAATLRCLAALGAEVTQRGSNLSIRGCSGNFSSPVASLDCGNSGSTLRMMAGLLAGQEGEFVLTGDASLLRRPMLRVAGPLRQMDAAIELHGDHAPMTIHGGRLTAITFQPEVASAQVKSAVLFAGLQARGVTVVQEPVRTRDHGELALRAFGAQIDIAPANVSIAGGQALHAIHADIPGDISSAAFFLCAAAVLPGSSLTIENLGLNPMRTAVLDVLTGMGALVRVRAIEEQHGELRGTLEIQSAPGGLRGAEISGALTARLIDELPMLAVLGAFTRDGVTLREARELRVKESDRIALVARNLRAMGAEVEEFDDGLGVPGGQTLHGAEIDSGGDHRIAMAFAIAALRAQGETLIQDAECAAVSFPEFWEMLEGVTKPRPSEITQPHSE